MILSAENPIMNTVQKSSEYSLKSNDHCCWLQNKKKETESPSSVTMAIYLSRFLLNSKAAESVCNHAFSLGDQTIKLLANCATNFIFHHL